MSPSRLAVAVLAALAAPAAAAEPDVPTLTVQAKPAGFLLDAVRGYIRAADGPDGIEKLDEAMKELFGEKGLAGLDLLRPIGGYAHLDPKGESAWGVVVLPVADETEFLDLLKRSKVTVEAEGQGLYKLTAAADAPAGSVLADQPLRMRFHDRHAYVGVNAPAAALDPAKLIPLRTLVDPAEPGAVAVRVAPRTLDAAQRKWVLDLADGWVKEAENDDTAWIKGLAGPLMKAARGWVGQATAEADRATVRVLADARAAELAYELAVTPRAGTPLAAEVAALRPPPNRFAGIVPPGAVGGVVVRPPLFTSELRDGLAAGVEGLKGVGDDAPDWLKPVVEAAVKAVARTAKAGRLEVGLAVTGPDGDGAFTAVLAGTLDDAPAVEKALRDALKDAPQEVRRAVRLEAAKAGGLAVYTIPLSLPEELRNPFGGNPTVSVAFGPDAAYLAVGPAARAELTRVVGLKPGPGRVLDARLNPARVRKLMAAADEGWGLFAQLLPERDELLNYGFFEVSGGPELRLRYGSTPAKGVFPFGP